MWAYVNLSVATIVVPGLVISHAPLACGDAEVVHAGDVDGIAERCVEAVGR